MTLTVPARVRRALGARARVARFRRLRPAPPADDVVVIGDLGYGGYPVPDGLLGPGSTVVSAGAGTDVSFEALLVARFGVRVHLLDPVPAAYEHARRALSAEPRVTVERAALWSEDTELGFHAPEIADHVSHSATDLHSTPLVFTAPARSLASLRAEFGWDRIDLLKISAEGSEFAILDAVLATAEPVTALCVEFAQPAPVEDVVATMDRLAEAGYRPLARDIRPFAWKMTFARAGRAIPSRA